MLNARVKADFLELVSAKIKHRCELSYIHEQRRTRIASFDPTALHTTYVGSFARKTSWKKRTTSSAAFKTRRSNSSEANHSLHHLPSPDMRCKSMPVSRHVSGPARPPARKSYGIGQGPYPTYPTLPYGSAVSPAGGL